MIALMEIGDEDEVDIDHRRVELKGK